LTGFRIESVEPVASVSFLALEQRRIVSPDGESFDRAVVRHPGAVAVVPLDADGHAVLVRQYRAAVDQLLLEIPAGKRDVDGEPVETTAERELEEEIGCRPGRLVGLGTFYNSPGFCDEHTHLFLGLDLEDVERDGQLRHEEAAMTVERVSLDAVPRLIANGEIIDAKTIIGLLVARERRSSAPGR